MIGELLVGLLGEALAERLGDSRRTRTLLRLGFGLLGTGLAIAGFAHFLARVDPGRNPAMHASMLLLFAMLACFCLFNIALLRRWRWPGLAFVFALVALFATRFAFGPP